MIASFTSRAVAQPLASSSRCGIVRTNRVVALGALAPPSVGGGRGAIFRITAKMGRGGVLRSRGGSRNRGGEFLSCSAALDDFAGGGDETGDDEDERLIILSAVPQQEERHPLWEPPPIGGDKQAKEAFNKKIKGMLNLLYAELKIAHGLHRDTSAIVTEISMRKRQLAATFPIESQIQDVERAIKRKIKTVSKLRLKEEHVAGHRQAAEDHLSQLNMSLSQLNEIKNEMDFDADEADENRMTSDPRSAFGDTAGPTTTYQEDNTALKRINEQLDYLTKAADTMMKNYASGTSDQTKPTDQTMVPRVTRRPLPSPPTTWSARERAAEAAPYRLRTPRAARARRTPTPPATHDAAEDSPDEVISGIRLEPGPGAVTKATRRTATRTRTASRVRR